MRSTYCYRWLGVVVFFVFFLPLTFSKSLPNNVALTDNFHQVTHNGVRRTLDLTSSVLREIISVKCIGI